MLAEISGKVKELDELRKIGMRADYDEVMKVYVKLSKLSSKYYSLIPVSESKDEVIRPIN